MSDTTETPVEPAGQVATATHSTGPQFYERELERARKDAAKYRDRARTEATLRTEFATREAELNSKIEALTAQIAETEAKVAVSERAATKLRLALEHGVAADKVESFTKRLVGETPEELAADAKSLAELFAAPAVQEDVSQGQGAAPLNSPTILNALQGVAARRR